MAKLEFCRASQEDKAGGRNQIITEQTLRSELDATAQTKAEQKGLCNYKQPYQGRRDGDG